MPTDTEKAKIVAAIKDMEKQAADLTLELEREKEFNLAAWNEYGSELCANELIGNERRISEKIKTIKEKINLLNDFLTGKISVLEEETLRTSDRLCAIIITGHEKRRAEIKTRIENIAFIKSLL